jgi:hypothetical protein
MRDLNQMKDLNPLAIDQAAPVPRAPNRRSILRVLGAALAASAFG